MPDPLPQSILCPVLIGRDVQVAALARLLEQAREPFGRGQGQIALISGEAGIGKSRLVAEAATQAQRQGFAHLAGRCFETDRTFPYAPLVDLLRTHLTQQPTAQVGAELHTMQRLTPLLPERMTSSRATSINAGADGEQEKRRIFQHLVDFLQQQTSFEQQPRPLLVTIEDLHWGDDLSLEWLLYLTRRLAQQPILLIGTYRSDEVQPALRHLVATLRRERFTHVFPLRPLEAPQVEAVIRAIFAHPQAVRSEFVERLHTLTDGNPFFIEEVLKVLVSEGDIFYAGGAWTRKALSELRIPPTVQDAVERRTHHLSPAAHQVLTLAAVIGRRCEFTLLQQLAQQEEATLLRLLKELIAAQLLVEEAADRFGFRHALTRQAIYNGLLGRERRALHRAVLAALESAAAVTAPVISELAHHAAAAEAWEKTLHYAQQAGEQALHLYAPHTALEHFAGALRAAEQLHIPPTATCQRACGQAYALISDFANARHAYTQALALARTSHDSALEWQSLIDLGTLAQEEDYQQAGDYFQAALALARTRQEPTALAYTLVWLGRWHAMMDQPAPACALQSEALAIFQRQQDETGVAITLSLLGWSYYVAADLYASVAAYQAAVTRCRTLDQRQWLIFSLAGLAMRGRDYFNMAAYWPPADHTGAIADAEDAIQLAQQIGYRSGEVRARIWFAMGLGVRGDYGRALVQAEMALQIAQADQQTRYIATVYHALGALYLDLLALSTAQPILEACWQLSLATRSATMHRYAAGLLAAVAVGQGRLDEAENLLDRTLPADAPTTSKTQRLIGCTRAELYLARQQPDQALAWVERLIATAGPPPATAVGEPVIPRLWHLRGEALLALNRLAEAETLLQTAHQVAAAQGMRPLCWRIQACLARLYQQQRRRDQALAALTAAQALLAELSLTLRDETLRQNFVEQARARLPILAPPTPLRAAKLSFAGLTLREREVAALIALGKTNGEIAKRLVISERTVAKHVENTLGKLGFTTRTQIAAWALEKGLAFPTAT